MDVRESVRGDQLDEDVLIERIVHSAARNFREAAFAGDGSATMRMEKFYRHELKALIHNRAFLTYPRCACFGCDDMRREGVEGVAR